MELEDGIKRIIGVIEVEAQGFFTERFINLCKINNIKIWDVITITAGIIRFKVAISDYKKLKKISKKTKCKIRVVSKKGMYFTFFKYRKRKMALFLMIMFILFAYCSTTFIFNIQIEGNEKINTVEILKALEESGLKKGTNRLFLNNKKVISNMRVLLPDISWIGMEIEGTTANIKVVEKTEISPSDIVPTVPGDIIAEKEGIIDKIVVENGTSFLNVGDYVEEGNILIEGVIYSELLENKGVVAKGKIKVRNCYYFEKDYSLKRMIKDYTGEKKHSIGFTINNNEKYINNLDKSLKYDIIKKKFGTNLFGNSISIDLYRFDLYNEMEIILTEEAIIEQAQHDADEYFDSIKNDMRDVQLLDSETDIEYVNDSVARIRIAFNVIETIGRYRERNSNE